ncbi:replication initiation protein RepC [Rhizobium sp. P32RR-XVIII]|uniref:plasmid replication protein RepC n=1 Tax=Rhizobium sp. P32RR-XVIII TaxID=2726738 RepID=UPI001456A40B|nr:plasmid replication protein RepC [Rhizobium sp. P32RR-XVIII]NLS07188.1 replication initiation protein RepC [Rhizobium sp. P32RR-XVIII]
MQSGSVSTPFGRRAMTLALVKGQLQTRKANTEGTVDKWRVYRDACEARERLGVTDRALAILSALLSFHPDQELSGDGSLVVFPSNAQLSLRANGITGTTLRRHLASLVESGLVIRNDSPNGKRYARRGDAGTVEEAFGFDLSPLLARQVELALMAQQVVAERKAFRLTRERLSIARRDVRKLISAAMEEGAAGDWAAIEAQFLALIARLPRNPDRVTLEDVAEEMAMLRDEILIVLENQLNVQKTSGNDGQNGCHIQNSDTESLNELEPASEEKQEAKPRIEPRSMREPIKAFPLSLVLTACPEIAAYGPGGAVGSWRDLMSAAIVVRSMLGVSPSAYQNACEILGPENSAAVMACILERAGHIQSAGGYLRDLTRRAERGEFSLGPMLMALVRSQPSTSRRA